MVNEEKVTLNCKNSTYREVLSEIRKQTGIDFVYDGNIVSSTEKVSLEVKNVSVKEALDKLFATSPYSYTITDNSIIIKSKPLVAQQKVPLEVKGKVLDEENNPVIGATIISMSGAGTITDGEGAFILNLPQAEEVEVSSVGFTTLTQAIAESSDNLVITIAKDEMAVQDVVVTGYFTKQKETYTGAVTTFSNKELKQVSTGNLLTSLSMLDPSFVQVSNNEMGSDPNTIPDFEIRGSGSLQSEYQGSSNMPTFILDGFEVSATKVYDLDVNRVKSMTILKDAAASAIYGSRAANGVVVIETIAPKAGELRIFYNCNLNFEVADLSSYDLMNAAEKLEYEWKAGLYSTYADSYTNWNDIYLADYNEKLKLVASGVDTDWMAIPVKSVGVGHKHSVTLEGGNESFRYGLDLYYSNKAGVMKESGRDSYGGSIRLQYNYKNLKFSNYTSFDHVKSYNSPYGDYSNYSYYNPYYDPYDEDGNVKEILYTYTYYDLGYQEKVMYNELYNALLPFKDESITNSVINNFSVEYDIASGLKFKSNISVSIDDYRSDYYLSNQNTYFTDEDNAIPYDERGSYSQTFSKDFSYDLSATLTYNKNIDKHNFGFGAVYNVLESQSDVTSISAIGFSNISMDHISMGSGFTDGATPSGDYDVTRQVGFVGNAFYTYENKYLFDASIRSDASSLFGADKRWGTFWSVGLGWNIHKEDFFNSDLFSLLKIRGSIGTTGSQNFYSYQSMATYTYNDSYLSDVTYLGYKGAILKALGNDDLKWQTTLKRNIGLDFDLLDRRISGSFNYYYDTSKDVLIYVTLAPSLGFSSYMENLGEVLNEGVELTLKGTVLRDYTKNFRWDLMLNVAHNKNSVVKINDALRAYNDEQDSDVGSSTMVRYAEGLSMNTIWVNESIGIDPATGQEIFIASDGTLTNEWSSSNYKAMGTTDPDLFGTFGTSLNYKGWEFMASFYYKIGGQIYNQTLVDKIENVNPNENGDKRILYDRWQEAGDVAKYKEISDVSTTQPTSRFIEDETYLQLQSLSLGYQFGTESLRRMGIENLKISAIGNDIFTTSTVKMERGTYYPYARTMSMSIQVTF